MQRQRREWAQAGSCRVSEPRLTMFFGRRGKPMLKPRLMPLRVAQAVALQLQARRVGTVSVL